MATQEIDALFAQTLSGDYDDEAPWEAVQALRRVGTQEVFEKAAEWCESTSPIIRARGADVLAQLGKTVDHPSNNFPEESYSVITGLLQRETEARPLAAAIAALGHRQPSCCAANRELPFASESRSQIRRGIRLGMFSKRNP
ncbi:MAG: hypothetical protein DMG69_20905 [Acidobacteria bacterium]|nr:MAG: hypothetical protein DMG69_20905 [Acidobacteriota bacterium]